MGKLRIMPHMRLQEWVAEEKGYFAGEGLDDAFVHGDGLSRRDSSVGLFGVFPSALDDRRGERRAQ
jgi:hypothetical protein